MIETLKTNAQQAAADLQNIKNAIKDTGVEVPDGTLSANYASKVEEVYAKGYDAANSEIEIAINNIVAKYGLGGDA